MAEARKWAAYRNLRGSLNQGLRVEKGFAIVAHAIYRVMGGAKDLKVEAFMPHVVAELPEQEDRFASPEEVLGLLQSLSKKTQDSERYRRIMARRESK